MKNHANPGLMRFYAGASRRRRWLMAWMVATVAAGTFSTVIQVILWRLFSGDWVANLLRDARLAAALLMGRSVLPPPASFDISVMAVATAVHFTLSLVYAGLVAVLVDQQPARRAAVLGAAFGLVLYLVNLHGFTGVFPWFAQARDWITVVTHVAFGVLAAVAYRWAVRW